MGWLTDFFTPRPQMVKRAVGPNEPSVVRRVSDTAMGILFGASPVVGPRTPEEAMSISAVYGSIRILSDDIGKLPIRLMERKMVDGVETITIAKNHQLHKLVSTRPNSWQTSTEFVRSIVTMAAIGKGALCILVKVSGEIREIIPVPNGAWTQETMSDGTTQYQVQFTNGTSSVFHQDQVLFIRGAVSIDGYSGVGVMSAARNAMEIIVGLERQQSSFSANSGRPSGIISLAEELTDEQKVNLKATWDSAYGPGGRGGVAVLEHATTFTPLSMSFAESQFIENREFQIREIARFFRIDPSYLFVEGTKTYASAESTRREHYTNCLLPWVVAIEQALNRALLNDNPNLFFDFDERDILRGNNLEQAQYLQVLLGSGGSPSIISVNEARYELGMSALKGDEYEKPSKGGYANAAQPIINTDGEE